MIFKSNIIKTPEFSRDGAHINKGKRKAPRVSSNKRGSQFLFDVMPFSPPPSYHFKNPF
jgi:hypothetical protein